MNSNTGTGETLCFILLILAGVLVSGCAMDRLPEVTQDILSSSQRGELKAGDIVHVPTRLKMDETQMLDIIASGRLIYVGETHDNIHAHHVQLAVIKGLHERFPGNIAIGMEMFREPVQEILDQWTAGELTEIEFLKRSRWHANWNLDFGYYREILEYARDNHIDLVALNPPRELQRTVSKSGLENLPEEIRKTLPETDLTDTYHRSLIEAVYGAHLKESGSFDSFYRVQVLWEETMAENVVRYLRSPSGEGKKIVVLAGTGHVQYGFGIPKRVLRRMPLAYHIILPEEISIPEDKPDRTMKYESPEIPLLPTDFLWMVAYKDLKSDRVRLGVQISDAEGSVKVVEIAPGSLAEHVDIRPGDIILMLDQQKILETYDLIYYLEKKNVGDSATVTIKRNGTEINKSVTFTNPQSP
jgi:uncharacterized iron-regulated protein